MFLVLRKYAALVKYNKYSTVSFSLLAQGVLLDGAFIYAILTGIISINNYFIFVKRGIAPYIWIMALAELCGLDKTFKFSVSQNEDKLHQDVEALTGNFTNNLQLATPPFANPIEGLAKLQGRDEHGTKIRMHIDHGTTTLGFRYQGGVVLAVDSRATGGSYIGCRDVKKVVEINDYLLGTLAGGAADCIYWDRVLTKHCRMYELRNRERISVAAASKLMSNMVYNYKGMGLSMGMMITGWDKRGPSLYYVDSDGTRTDGMMFSAGSGSVYAFGIIDSGLDWNMKDEDAYELGRRAIYHATFRDAYSGGFVRVYHMTENGWKCISVEDCLDLHYKYTADPK